MTTVLLDAHVPTSSLDGLRPGIPLIRYVDQVFVAGDLQLREPAGARRISIAAEWLDECGRLPVSRLIRYVNRVRQAAGVHLVITDFELAIPGFSGLFGYARRSSGIAVVSTARLGTDPTTVARRIAGVAAHELGHLNRLGHCRMQACVMRPVRTVDELDARPLSACGNCPPLKKWPVNVAEHIIAAFRDETRNGLP